MNTNTTMAHFGNDMKSEFKRYATFSGFKTPSGVWPSHLAQAGFYRSGASRNQVVCFSCGLEVDVDIFAGESVTNVHQRLSPSCGFMEGASNNQPFPVVDTGDFQGLDWISQHLGLGGGGGSSTARDFQFHSLPSELLDSDVADDGGVEEESVNTSAYSYTYSSLPPLSFSQCDLPVLPMFSDLNTLEQTTDLDSLPLDILEGFANTNLQSASPSALFQASNYDPASHPFRSILSEADDVVADGVSAGVEGEAPAPLMQEYEIGNYTSQQTIPPSSQLLTDNESEMPRQKITYDDLGIVVQRPKKQDMATLGSRVKTFERWQGGEISQTTENIAEAGFYYAGYSDCCRCFYCGGGLKSWVKDDDPWIEHARWFKECPYVKTCKGVDFIEAVLALARTNNVISMKDVEQEIQQIKRQSTLITDGDDLTYDQISEDMDTTLEMTRLEKENDSLKRPEICKICLDEDVGVLFVPCGHLVTCFTCSPSVQACPVCRQQIQGRVRITRGD